jgi:hypothetical protein
VRVTWSIALVGTPVVLKIGDVTLRPLTAWRGRV